MLMNAPATFIQSYIDDLNDALNQLKPGAALTRIQAAWLGTCLTGILLMNSVCWAKFERASLGDCKVAALSWVLRKASIPWDCLLRVSVVLILKRYGITESVLAFDESDRARSKSTKRIYKVYKQKHKGSGGYVNGQTIVLLLLVTSSITVPVGFFFYMPDPALKQWDKEDKRLKKSGIAKKDRPIKPERDSAYPTKTEIASGAPCYLTKFWDSCRHNSFTYAADGRCPERPASATTTHKSRFVITTSLAGRLFGMQFLLLSRAASTRRISELPCRLSGADSGGSQVISQLRKNQNIEYRGRIRSVESYFNSINKGIDQIIRVRGGKEIKVNVSSARLKVSSHSKKRFVIALKYDGENYYRYLVATDLTWRTQYIIQAYTLRWLIEVFFEDWKLYEGWGREAKQLDEEGSSRGLILSLLFDHCLLLHTEQIARIESKRNYSAKLSSSMKL
ncbi:hypothetical protein BJAS_P1414 [Bathymodiolus japonicus methanotrophic gill symbiont]|uniref:transposase n=1 Tax=Bathymodiolus japonicus methanotrophic gill symbiont TaxID=113269 RepID=UPI001B6353B4|nr:transposase [Bathymodiolus japonicus methanotrophic gill symbiont]GFO71735.1 hypothetical protein BJAS_P1414 [Bathymodiolus japonicus methanotrophic gill symbiont]